MFNDLKCGRFISVNYIEIYCSFKQRRFECAIPIANLFGNFFSAVPFYSAQNGGIAPIRVQEKNNTQSNTHMHTHCLLVCWSLAGGWHMPQNLPRQCVSFSSLKWNFFPITLWFFFVYGFNNIYYNLCIRHTKCSGNKIYACTNIVGLEIGEKKKNTATTINRYRKSIQ